MSTFRYGQLKLAVNKAFRDMPHETEDGDYKLNVLLNVVSKQFPDATVDELTFILDEIRLNGAISGILIAALGGLDKLVDSETIPAALDRAAASGSSYAKLVLDSGFLDRHQLGLSA